MPGHAVHPTFDVVTYRTPRGERNQRDQSFLSPPDNLVNYGFVSEMIIGTMHTGTHIDALSHVAAGDPQEWFGGRSVDTDLGDFGVLSWDAAQLPPLIARGVLLDIPHTLGAESCPVGYPIGETDLERAAEVERIQVLAGDVVLVRTGQMKGWPDQATMEASKNSGVSLNGAEWLAAKKPVAVGADNVAFECTPSGIKGIPQPVHLYLIKECGIPILEWVNCEELASNRVYEFLFVCLPLRIIGATGSLVRPIAIS